jgi:hypothetical protein
MQCYHELAEYSTHFHILVLYEPFQYCLIYTKQSHGLFLSDFLTKMFYAFLISPCMLHALLT